MDIITQDRRPGTLAALTREPLYDGFSMTAAELAEHQAAQRGGQVVALLTKAEAGCTAAGGLLSDNSPERAVMQGHIIDYARTFGLREHDCLPRVAFNCPRCQGAAQVLDVVTYSCTHCGAGTRFTLAVTILSDPELLARFLAVVPTASRSTGRGNAA